MKTKEELLERIRKVDEYNDIRGFHDWGHNNYVRNNDVLILENFEKSDNMCNFTLEFLELLKKYGVKMHGSNGMLETFEFSDAPEKFLGIAPFFRWLPLSDDEMNTEIEKTKLDNIRKELNKKETSLNEDVEDDEVFYGCDDCNEEGQDECELYNYDAVGSFIADIEINVGKIESNEDTIDDDLAQECWDKLLDALGDDGVEIDNDDDVFETLKFKILEDGTTLVKCKNAECSVRVDIQASCLDEANDERWSAFSKKIRPLEYLKNIREDYVSEAD